MCASDVFIRESTAGAPQIPEDCILGYSMKDELDSLVSALRRLGETFPVACEYFIIIDYYKKELSHTKLKSENLNRLSSRKGRKLS